MKLIKYIWPLVVIPLLFAQCRKESLLTDSNAGLEFSTDTLIFDTVFTTIGSATYTFKIYNRHDQPINISSLSLAGGSSSPFRLNVDGLPTISTSDVEIPANDSLFVFAEVTIDPLNSNLPLVIEDSVMFNTNGNQQAVKLVAWGQDAHFHLNETLSCNETWVADKPHVIYGFARVDSACSLNIQAGTKIHSHNNALLYVYKGSLVVTGTVDNPVVFEGDRLESFYDDIAGQWFGILMQFPQNSSIDYAQIRNASVGLWMDTISDDGMGTSGLTIQRTIIENMSTAGLYLRGATVSAENVLVSNCGQFCFASAFGGQYDFKHCTFANYWSENNRQDPLFAMSNWYESSNGSEIIRPLINTRFDNCIFYGSNTEELLIDIKDDAAQDYLFNHCLFKTEQNLSGSRYNSVFVNFDPAFVSTSAETPDYHISSGGYPINKGDFANSVFGDLDNLSRFDGQPDLGCYEAQ